MTPGQRLGRFMRRRGAEIWLGLAVFFWLASVAAMGATLTFEQSTSAVWGLLAPGTVFAAMAYQARTVRKSR